VSPNGWAFSGEPSERSERPERKRGRRVRCNAMFGGWVIEGPETSGLLEGPEAVGEVRTALARAPQKLTDVVDSRDRVFRVFRLGSW
jgi:hypothetical protein